MSMTQEAAPRKPADRALRAYQQSQDYLVYPEPGTETAWGVTNIRTGAGYVVDGNTCSCPDHTRRSVACKHVHLVRLHEQCEADTRRAQEDASCRARLEQRATEVERGAEKARESRKRFVSDWDCES